MRHITQFGNRARCALTNSNPFRDRAALPGEPSGGFLDIPVHPQPLDLPPRPLQLLALERRQSIVQAPLFQIRLLDTLPDRRRRGLELLSQRLRRSPRAHQPNDLSRELRRVPPLLPCPSWIPPFTPLLWMCPRKRVNSRHCRWLRERWRSQANESEMILVGSRGRGSLRRGRCRCSRLPRFSLQHWRRCDRGERSSLVKADDTNRHKSFDCYHLGVDSL